MLNDGSGRLKSSLSRQISKESRQGCAGTNKHMHCTSWKTRPNDCAIANRKPVKNRRSDISWRVAHTKESLASFTYLHTDATYTHVGDLRLIYTLAIACSGNCKHLRVLNDRTWTDLLCACKLEISLVQVQLGQTCWSHASGRDCLCACNFGYTCRVHATWTDLLCACKLDRPLVSMLRILKATVTLRLQSIESSLHQRLFASLQASKLTKVLF